MSGWQIKTDNASVQHVVPVDDLREHVPVDCWCEPKEVDDMFYSHNALDEREKFETGERKPS